MLSVLRTRVPLAALCLLALLSFRLELLSQPFLGVFWRWWHDFATTSFGFAFLKNQQRKAFPVTKLNANANFFCRRFRSAAFGAHFQQTLPRRLSKRP